MQRLKSLKDLILKIPIFTAADINSGAAVMPGVTVTDSAAKDLGTAILSDAAGIGRIGFMDGLYDYSEEGSAAPNTGVTWPSHEVKPSFDAMVCRAQIDLTSTITVTSYTGSTITLTSLENDIDSSWVYVVGGTGAGQTGFVITSGSGSCVVKSAFTTDLDGTSTIVKIPRIFHGLQYENATFDKFGTQAAVGAKKIKVLNTWIERNGYKELLTPVNHHNLQGLNSAATNVKFWVDYLDYENLGHPIA